MKQGYAAHLCGGLCFSGPCRLACCRDWPCCVLAWVSHVLREQILWQRLIPGHNRENCIGVFAFTKTRAKASCNVMSDDCIHRTITT